MYAELILETIIPDPGNDDSKVVVFLRYSTVKYSVVEFGEAILKVYSMLRKVFY